MKHAIKPQDSEELAQRAARNLRGILAAERWSGRKAALALGLTPMYVTRRLKGDAELSFSDIAMFAGLLGVDEGALYTQLMRESGFDQPTEARVATLDASKNSNRGAED